jgi:DNA polymerase-1
MVRIFERLEREKMKSRLLLQVHDELVLEAHKDEIDQVRDLVTEEMKDLSSTPVKKLKVELSVEAGIGATWGSIA